MQGTQSSETTTETSGDGIENGMRAYVFCPKTATSLCDCEIIKNISSSQVNSGSDYLYIIDKKKTTAYIRKRRSAYDGRFSAKCLGYTGSVVIIAVLLLVVCSDVQWCSAQKTNKKPTKM